ncbi:MAG: hypothetical protein JOZ47_10760 [Kutzneria sp.]|nr:hypothetical protein [Kutzneria sp.]
MFDLEPGPGASIVECTRLTAQTPRLVTANMAAVLWPGKAFIDWSQNNLVKTTIAPYSVRDPDHRRQRDRVVLVGATVVDLRACGR